MKKVIFLLLFAASNLIIAQNIAFEQVGIQVDPGNGSYVLDLLDDFYGNIEKPEGVNISLNRVYFKPEGVEATHYLTFTGTVKGLAALRKIRGGNKYSTFNTNILKFGKVVSTVGGSTLMRMNLDKAALPVVQVWKWRVDDVSSFAGAFSNLIKGFPQEGYLSLGQFSHGTSSDGETHYIYVTHEDYEAALGWGPKTQQQRETFVKFQKATNKYSNFLGSMTLMNVKTW